MKTGLGAGLGAGAGDKGFTVCKRPRGITGAMYGRVSFVPRHRFPAETKLGVDVKNSVL